MSEKVASDQGVVNRHGGKEAFWLGVQCKRQAAFHMCVAPKPGAPRLTAGPGQQTRNAARHGEGPLGARGPSVTP